MPATPPFDLAQIDRLLTTTTTSEHLRGCAGPAFAVEFAQGAR